MGQYVTQHPDNATLMRLKLAQILALHEKRPAQALKVMGRIEPATLDPCEREFFEKLRAKAVEMQKHFPSEVATEDS